MVSSRHTNTVISTQGVFDCLVPKLDVNVPELSIRIKSSHKLNELTYIWELLNNVFWIGMTHTLCPVFTVPKGLQQIFHLLEEVNAHRSFGLEINKECVPTVAATHHGIILFRCSDLKVVVGHAISFHQVPFAYGSQDLLRLCVIKSKLNVSMRDPVISFLAQNVVVGT